MQVDKVSILRFFYRLDHFGVFPGQSSSLQKKVILSNRIAIGLAGTAVPFLILDIFGQQWLLALLNSLVMVVFGLELVLNHFRFHTLSRWYLLWLIYFLFLGVVYLVGKDTQSQVVLIVSLSLAFVVFDLKERASLIINTCLNLICYFSVILNPGGVYDGGHIPTYGGIWGQQIVSVSMFLIIIYFFRSANDRAETLLESTIERLEKSQMQLRSQQQLLVQASKMSALGEMASGIAHEINSPLAIIEFRVSHMRKLMDRSLFTIEEGRSDLNVIESIVQRIANIVSGLRAFSRDTSLDQFQTEKVKSIVDDTLALCRERFIHYGVALKVATVSPELTIECRPIQISQVLLNLLSNAFDAVQSEKEKWVELSVNDRGQSVELIVMDSGPGVQPVDRGRVFEPFFTRKEVGMGAGLGLSISKGIIEAHHGSIAFDYSSPHTRCVVSLIKRQNS